MSRGLTPAPTYYIALCNMDGISERGYAPEMMTPSGGALGKCIPHALPLYSSAICTKLYAALRLLRRHTPIHKRVKRIYLYMKARAHDREPPGSDFDLARTQNIPDATRAFALLRLHQDGNSGVQNDTSDLIHMQFRVVVYSGLDEKKLYFL